MRRAPYSLTSLSQLGTKLFIRKLVQSIIAFICYGNGEKTTLKKLDPVPRGKNAEGAPKSADNLKTWVHFQATGNMWTEIIEHGTQSEFYIVFLLFDKFKV